MAVQTSVTVRNAANDARETATGTSPHFYVYTGTQPADCAAAATGTLLCNIALPADWLTASSSGVKSMAGTWTGTGIAAGTAGHFRILDSTETTCHMQGSITVTGGGGDATMANLTIAVDQPVQVNTFSLTEANA